MLQTGDVTAAAAAAVAPTVAAAAVTAAAAAMLGASEQLPKDRRRGPQMVPRTTTLALALASCSGWRSAAARRYSLQPELGVASPGG